MDAILARTSDAPITQTPAQPAYNVKRALHLLLKMAHAAADRLTSPPRDVPPDFYRFPPL